MKIPPALLLLAGCHQATAPTRSAAVGIDDPAVRAAINDPIMIDPGLRQSSNADAIRPPPMPDPLAIPPHPARSPAPR